MTFSGVGFNLFYYLTTILPALIPLSQSFQYFVIYLIVSIHLSNYHHTLSALIFPTCRSLTWINNGPAGNLQFYNIFTNFFHTVNMLPQYFDHCHINPYTCLTLPFSDIIILFDNILQIIRISHTPAEIVRLPLITRFFIRPFLNYQLLI